MLAGKTAVLSLPSKWVKKYNINKGDELDIQEIGNELKISVKKEYSPLISQINISDLNSSLVWYSLTSEYKKGAEEIKVIFENEKVKTKTGELIPTITLIQRIVNSLIGMEVISQGKKHCIIKEITSIKPEEFDNILRRVYFSVINLADESLKALKEKDSQTLESLNNFTEESINNLTSLCMRTLNKGSYKTVYDSSNLFLTCHKLEEIADSVKRISKILINKDEISEQVFDICGSTNSILKEFVKTAKFKKEKAQDLHYKISEIKKRIREKETPVSYLQFNIVASLLDIIVANLENE